MNRNRNYSQPPGITSWQQRKNFYTSEYVIQNQIKHQHHPVYNMSFQNNSNNGYEMQDFAQPSSSRSNAGPEFSQNKRWTNQPNVKPANSGYRQNHNNAPQRNAPNLNNEEYKWNHNNTLQSSSSFNGQTNRNDNYFSNDSGNVYEDIRRPLQENLLNKQYYPTSMHRNYIHKSDRTVPRTLENRREWMRYGGCSSNIEFQLEDHADQIVGHMEKDASLMEDNPESEELRREALRDMPQSLTIKRCVKNKLKKSVTMKSKQKPIGIFKRWRYSTSIAVTKFNNELKNISYYFELWYSSLKKIEGNHGSGIATYFKFLKWLFILNFLITIPALVFVVVPQIFKTYFETEHIKLLSSNESPENNKTFNPVDVITGEGHFTDTILFYGHYSKDSIYITSNLSYSIPYAYFFTMVCVYFTVFGIVSVSMARTYRRSFIETKGGVKNVFAHKIFCGWDYQIATKEAAELKYSTLYHELKELLKTLIKDNDKRSCMDQFRTKVIQIIAHIFIFALLATIGYILWVLLGKHKSSLSATEEPSVFAALLPAIIINIILLIVPIIFSFIIKYEDYKSHSTALSINLSRIFLLQIVVVGVLVVFWLTSSNKEVGECWETQLGQEIYRLIIFDFFISIVLEALLVLGQSMLHKCVSTVGPPDFDIARHTLQIIYNQTLLWIGLFFSPLLPVVIVIKLWLTWYIRCGCVLYLCKPRSKSWRAATAHALFYILSFLCLILVMSVFVYLLIEIPSSGCGPFEGFISKGVIDSLLKLGDGNQLWYILRFIMKPGVVALILVALAVAVYYQRAKSQAQIEMVDLLREMLHWEAKDKEYLIHHISKVTQGQWQYKLKDGRAEVWDPIKMIPRNADDNYDGLSNSDDLNSSNSLLSSEFDSYYPGRKKFI